MIKYSFKDAPIAIKAAKKADPNKIGSALANIADQNGGELKPQAVVDAAINPRSPLHRHFEWDDTKAANAFRLDQAREIIRVIRVEVDNNEPTRAFLSVSDKHTSYRSIQEIQGSAHLQSLILKQADRDLAAFEKRYRDLTDVCADIAEAREKIRKRETEVGLAAH